MTGRQADDSAPAVDTSLLDVLTGHQMRRAMTAATADLMVALEGTALRPVHFAMLAVVRRNPGIIQTALGNALGIQRANLVPPLNELCESGLIERRTCAHDKRAYALHLTKTGNRRLDDALARVAEHETRFFGRLAPRERAALTRILARLARG